MSKRKKQKAVSVKDKRSFMSIYDAKAFRTLKTPNAKLEKAAKEVMREIKKHFSTKPGGWDLDFESYKDDVFYKAFGHSLENYLLKRIPKGVSFAAKFGDSVDTVLTKTKRGKQ